jgi:hypothetical protein
LPRQPRTEDYGRELDHIPDANLPDPKSVPADVQLLVEEARIGCTSAIPSRRHRNMIDIRIFDHRGQSSLGVANSCWVCSSQSVERSTLARRPFYWGGETSFRQPVVQARRLSRSAKLTTENRWRDAHGQRPETAFVNSRRRLSSAAICLPLQPSALDAESLVSHAQ